MFDYYRENLAAERLRAAYETAPPRTRQYLAAEAAHVSSKITAGMAAVELGCGYGRFLREIYRPEGRFTGLDNSPASLMLAKRYLEGRPGVSLAAMNAVETGFKSGSFDLTLCVQNGISAFHVDPEALIREAVRITKAGGLAVFSTYAAVFWPHRLEWFKAQAAAGLIGPIDDRLTRDGIIVCKDGFRATTMDENGFRALASAVRQEARLVTVDGSSLFCEINVKK